MQLICDGQATKAGVSEDSLEEYRGVYIKARREFNVLLDVRSTHIIRHTRIGADRSAPHSVFVATWVRGIKLPGSIDLEEPRQPGAAAQAEAAIPEETTTTTETTRTETTEGLHRQRLCAGGSKLQAEDASQGVARTEVQTRRDSLLEPGDVSRKPKVCRTLWWTSMRSN